MNYLETFIFDEDGEIYFICPICNKISEDGYDFQIEDYVNIPMIWCNHCGARCVMSKKQFVELDPNKKRCLKSNIKTEDVPENIRETFREKVNFEDGFFVKVKFVKINRVINRELENYITDKDANQLELQHFINSNFDKEVGKKYRYFVRIFDENEEDDPLEFNDYNSFKMGLKIDSFDSMSPNLIDIPFELGVKGDIHRDGETVYSSVENDNFRVIKTKEENTYNRYLDMSHDGIYIHLECVDTDGSLFYCRYWGD